MIFSKKDLEAGYNELWETDIQKDRLRKVTYKVYALWLCLIMYVGWPLLNTQIIRVHGEEYLQHQILKILNGWGQDGWSVTDQHSLNWEEDNRQTGLYAAVSQTQLMNDKISTTLRLAQQENTLITWLTLPRIFETIKRCRNELQCDWMSQLQRDRIESFRHFYSVWWPMEKGSDMLQKNILRHLQETLLMWPQEIPFGRIRSIHFGWLQKKEPPKNTTISGKYNLYALPIHLTIDFAQQEKLIWFLKNIEYMVLKQEKSMFITIDTIKYDIGQNTLMQTLDTTLTVVFYELE
jgi:hypothetical protein